MKNKCFKMHLKHNTCTTIMTTLETNLDKQTSNKQRSNNSKQKTTTTWTNNHQTQREAL